MLRSRHSQCASNSFKHVVRTFVILSPTHQPCLPLGSSKRAATHKSCAQRVTFRPSVRQCSGSLDSALQSMKSSVHVQPTPSALHAGGTESERTIECFTMLADEEGSGFERRRSHAQLIHMRYRRWQRRRAARSRGLASSARWTDEILLTRCNLSRETCTGQRSVR